MQISVKEAQENLDELVARVEGGEDIVLTRAGKTVARIVPLTLEASREERRAVLDRVRAMAPPRRPGEPTADRSHDDLYDENGLPA
jgi:prevent-host-death family protein